MSSIWARVASDEKACFASLKEKYNLCHELNINLWGTWWHFSSLIENPTSRLLLCPPFLTWPPQFVLANCVWICTVVSNCINLGSHIRQGPFRRHPIASCIVGNASGRWNQSDWSWEKELIIYWSHTPFSVTPVSLSNTAFTLPVPLSPPFPLLHHFSPSILLSFSSNPLSAKHSFFFWCHTFEHKPFLLFSCVVAVNNGKMRVLLCGKFSLALFWFCYHITTARGTDASCQTRRLGSDLYFCQHGELSGTVRWG